MQQHARFKELAENWIFHQNDAMASVMLDIEDMNFMGNREGGSGASASGAGGSGAGGSGAGGGGRGGGNAGSGNAGGSS